VISPAGFLFFMIGWTVLVITAMRRRPIVRQAEFRLPIADPGPLDDVALRRALADSRLGPASPLRDRVQDAFERLLRDAEKARKPIDIDLVVGELIDTYCDTTSGDMPTTHERMTAVLERHLK
jgi:hypothetical protein